MNGPTWDTSTWDDTVSELLRLQGQGTPIHETVDIYNEPQLNTNGFGNQAISITENTTVNYPGGGSYTMDVGYFSLNGASENETWTSTNGTSVTLNYTLPLLYNNAVVPSNSWSYTAGSPTFDLSGSLVLGGYDRSRCLTDPITSTNSTFQLQSINLGVTRGGSAFLNLPDTGNASIATMTNISMNGLSVLPNPGVPYLYLPQATCDAIAKFLPVTYNSDFALYFWNTTSPAFSAIVSSPHNLKFNFISSDASANTAIHVPLALLNLTLQSPLVSTDTQYFPCSPYSPSDGTTYHLGRAFLQAAFVAQNWGTNTSWLAQAPGPGLSAEQITNLEPDDATLASMVNGPDWLSTWSGHLKALDTSSTGSGSSAAHSGSSGLSGGAIAGIVIGVIAGLAVVAAILWFVLRRKRRARRGGAGGGGPEGEHEELKEMDSVSGVMSEAGSRPVLEVQGSEIHEAGASEVKKGLLDKPVELGGSEGLSLVELPGSDVDRRR